VRAFVLGTRSSGLELGEMDPGADIATELERLEANALELGVTVAGDPAVLTEMAPDLLHGAGKAWSFGRGLARGAKDRGAVWTKLVAGLGQVSPEERDVGAMVGYLVELSGLDGDLAQNLLDAAIDQPDLAGFVPALQSGVPIDTRGAARLIRALKAGRTPVQAFRWLAGRPGLPEGADFKALLSLILEESGGFDVALEILSMRLHSDQSEKREHEPELVEIGQELLRRVRFRKNRELDAHSLGTVVRACLVGAETAPVAADVARRLRQAVADHETYAYENDELLKALLLSQPLPVLDALFEGTDDDRFAGVGVFDHSEGHHANPADGIPGETLIAWCDRDGDPRYPIAASIVSFARNGEVAGSKVWSEHAWALLTHAPDPGKVLDVFVGRFRPMSGSGSTAVEMEANARLLDSLDMEFPVGFRPLVAAAKDRMTREIGSQREWETKMDRGRDEAFE